MGGNTLKRLLAYSEQTGQFTWKVNRRGRFAMKGTVAGTVRPDGYRAIMVDGQSYLAHRLAWFFVHGDWPEQEIDHIDCNRDNNKIDNLREATSSDNSRNSSIRSDNKTGIKGVRYRPDREKYYVQLDGKHLGVYDTLSEAEEIVRKHREESHAQFTNHG